jgi:hypothetical protein
MVNLPKATVTLTDPQVGILLQMIKYWRETESAFELVESKPWLPKKTINLNPEDLAEVEKILLKAMWDCC